MFLASMTVRRPFPASSSDRPRTDSASAVRPVAARDGWRVAGQCAAIMVLCGFDAWATLRLLEAGCVEANPAMQVLLDWGVVPFLAGKFALTGAGVRCWRPCGTARCSGPGSAWATSPRC